MTSPSRPPVVINLHVEAFADSRDETFTVDRDEWEAMTPQQRNDLADSVTEDFVANYVSSGWHIEDADDYASTDIPS
jgi:hypothetical protein